MTAYEPDADPVAGILSRHGSPPIAKLADDIAGTYWRIADLLGVRGAGAPLTARAGSSGAAVHGDLAALAAAVGDRISTREHLLTMTRLASAGDDLGAMMRADAQLGVQPDANSIYAVYDLGLGPITYDFIHFLVLAESFRQRSGKRGLYVIFTPAAGDGFRHATPRDHFLGRDRKLWRLANLLAPCAYLIPNCIGATICQTRDEARTLLQTLPEDAVYPPLYSVDTPSCPYFMPQVQRQVAAGANVRTLQAPPVAAELVQRWFAEIAGTKPVVSITMRESDFQPARNSNVAAWRQFAEMCIAQGFHPVFVPDTEALLGGTDMRFEGFSTLDLPALSIGYRMAVYEKSFINAMVSNGPYTLCAYHTSARYLIFKILNPGVAECTAADLARHGIHPNRQLPFAGPQQRLVWEFDEPESIERAFLAMVEAVLAERETEPVAAAV